MERNDHLSLNPELAGNENEIAESPASFSPEFAAALAEENKRSFEEILSKYGLKIILVLSAALLVSGTGNVLQSYWLRHQPYKYFATADGTVIPQHPTNKPAYSAEHVMDFASKTMVKALALNFVNYENQLASVRPDFIQSGYIGFRKALVDSGLLKKIQDKRLNLKMTTAPGALMTEGVIEQTDVYAWQFRIPVVVQLVGQAQDFQPENYDLLVQIQQVDVREDPRGIKVAQVILKPRNS